MTDLIDVLPDFDLKPWRHLLFSLEKNEITVTELISLDPIEIVRRCPLPLRDLRSLIGAVIEAIHEQLGYTKALQDTSKDKIKQSNNEITNVLQKKSYTLQNDSCIKTLDPAIDELLGGGIFTKHVTEIVGESAVGKTQFVLNLLLSVQLPSPFGLGKSAIYISTESPLSTRRLDQMLSSNPEYDIGADSSKPTLDRIHTIEIRDLEAQEHVIQYQLPNAIEQYNVGLLVLDSVAANYRSEFESGTVKGLAERAVELVRLGSTLRQIARRYNVAVVVTNQVSDRFDDLRINWDRFRNSSPMNMSSQSSGTQKPSITPSAQIRRDGIMSLDNQQRYFTGWGNDNSRRYERLKTPALGLTWVNQISARIVLKMESERRAAGTNHSDYLLDNDKKRRYLSVVFASWAEPTINPLKYEIQARGIVALSTGSKEENDPDLDYNKEEHAELLHPELWNEEDEEYP